MKFCFQVSYPVKAQYQIVLFFLVLFFFFQIIVVYGPRPTLSLSTKSLSKFYPLRWFQSNFSKFSSIFLYYSSILFSSILHEIIPKSRISCSRLSAPWMARKHQPEAAKKNHAHNNKLSGRTVRPEERIGVLDDSRDARSLVERRG